jgi:UDP-glucose 4-epimerase
VRILVTGGSGYIGAHTVRRLQQDGSAVVVVDRVPPPAVLRPGVERFVEGDIRTPGLLDSVFADTPIDAVIHLAADKSVEASVADPGTYFSNNVGGTLALLQAMHRADVGTIVFSSTCAVYGTPDDVPVTEDSPVRPESPYGASKLMAEDIIDWYGRSHGLRHVALRYFNAAGAALEGDMGEDWADAKTLVPRVMKAALERSGPLTIFGNDYPTPDGTTIRDYVHVLDLADAHVLAVRALLRSSTSAILNLGTGVGTSVLELIEMTREVAGMSIPTEIGPRRPGDAVSLWADTTRAAAEISWRPQYTLRDIVETAWRWHTTHPDGASSATQTPSPAWPAQRTILRASNASA